jgi:signal transduction histidine kinase
MSDRRKADVTRVRRRYRERMGAPSYLPRSRLDIAVAVVGLALTTVATWVHPNPLTDDVAGPGWLMAVYPFLLSLPLAWRRQAPLAAFLVVMGAAVLQSVLTGNSTEGVQNLYCAGIAMYSAGRYCQRRRAAVALAVGMLAYAVYAMEDTNIRSGDHGQLWSGAFFAVAFIGTWLVGVIVRSRTEERVAALRAEGLERAAEQAVVDERARLARELHDVVSHNLSVMVVQAAGARASGGPSEATLEKIERSGRASLVEMRRLLGVLRQDGGDSSLAPQPGVHSLPDLVAQVRTAGLDVDLRVEGRSGDLTPAVDLSVYRIVQESLTNILKHSGTRRATVVVTGTPTSVTVEVVDDGPASSNGDGSGHGLVGMRERVAMFGGELETGSLPGGGFHVRAQMPLDRADA